MREYSICILPKNKNNLAGSDILRAKRRVKKKQKFLLITTKNKNHGKIHLGNDTQ